MRKELLRLRVMEIVSHIKLEYSRQAYDKLTDLMCHFPPAIDFPGVQDNLFKTLTYNNYTTLCARLPVLDSHAPLLEHSDQSH